MYQGYSSKKMNALTFYTYVLARRCFLTILLTTKSQYCETKVPEFIVPNVFSLKSMFLLHANTRSRINYKPNQSLRHLYDSMKDNETYAPYFLDNGWYKLERYHKFSDIPKIIKEIHWQTEPDFFSSWGKDKLITIIVDGHSLRLYVRNLDTTLQRLYNKTYQWASSKQKPWQGELYDQGTGQKLELNQLLLNVCTRKFEIK
tara:strand:- start:1720 stop:2325 length:606 start_codon:yes stop_codon:yes gene_type:complete